MTAVLVLVFTSGGFSILGVFFFFSLGCLVGGFVAIGVVFFGFGGLEIWIGVVLLRLEGWFWMTALWLVVIGAFLVFIFFVWGVFVSVVSFALNVVVIGLLFGLWVR